MSELAQVEEAETTVETSVADTTVNTSDIAGEDPVPKAKKIPKKAEAKAKTPKAKTPKAKAVTASADDSAQKVKPVRAKKEKKVFVDASPVSF
jgi:hypothetical protein